MRPALLAVLLAACAPKTAPQTPIDEDLGAASKRDSSAPAPAVEAPRPIAPTGKGLRTGTIPRDKLVAVLDAGPGMFLRQLEIAPQLSGERFVGWQLVQLLDRTGPLVDVDVVPGDVLLAINGKPLSRPDQLQSVWDSLRTANQVTAQLWRGQAQFELQFAIEPPVAAPAPAPTKN
jgi:S1-C subfamily serine protease